MKLKKNFIASAIALSLISPAVLHAQTVPAPTTPDPNSAEFKSQAGLGAINILPAWAQGLTGAGIVIANLDSGVNFGHVDLQGRLLAGADFTGSGTVADTTPESHGTAVTGIMVANFNGLSQVGISYKATVLPVKIGTGASSGVAVAGINFAAADPSVRIIVTSYVSDNSDQAAELAALQAAAVTGKIVVIGAGNEGFPEARFPANMTPSLGGLGITVGAINGEGTTIFSSRAGTNTSFMVAPGLSITSLGNSSSTALANPLTGSSMAAPHVAGAAALLLSAAPNLTGKQVVEILLTTARDIGTPGFDSTYGWGMLDLGNALAPLGALTGGGGGGGGGIGGIAGGLGLVGILAALNKKGDKKTEALETTLVFDKYQRPYILDVRRTLFARDNRPDLENLLRSFRSGSAWFDVELGDRQRLSVSTLSDVPVLANAFDYFSRRALEEERNIDVAMSLSGDLANGLQYQFNLNRDPRRAYGFLGATEGAQFLSERVFTAPYMGFANRANSMNLAYNLNAYTDLRFGVANMEENKEYGRSSSSALMEGAFRFSDKASAAIQLGTLSERGGLFGGSPSGGVFGVDQSNTLSLGISGRYKLTPDLILVGSLSEGYTRAKAARHAYLTNYSGLRTQTYGLGVLARNMWRRGDRLGIAVTQPLRLTSGQADLTVPQTIDFQGNIGLSDTNRVGLNPDGSELDIEVSYQWLVGHTTKFASYFQYRNEPYHAKSSGAGYTFYTVVRKSF
ncbi:MAG TPA: hypothetical protein ENI80_10010 [Acidiferrobacteraceae bacterium]|nr:hypothetical protein [Acidiferrobacteraceae bacterium]